MFRWFISLFEKSWSMLSTSKVVTLLKGIAHVVWLTRGRFICWLALCRSTIHHSRSPWQRLRLPWWDWWKKLIDIPSGCVFCFFKAAMCCMHCTVIPKENIYNGYISGDYPWESHFESSKNTDNSAAKRQPSHLPPYTCKNTASFKGAHHSLQAQWFSTSETLISLWIYPQKKRISVQQHQQLNLVNLVLVWTLYRGHYITNPNQCIVTREIPQKTTNKICINLDSTQMGHLMTPLLASPQDQCQQPRLPVQQPCEKLRSRWWPWGVFFFENYKTCYLMIYTLPH